MLPVRPCSSLIAASSARMAGGEPSYPTTRYRSPAGGAVAFIAAKAIRFPVRRPGIRHADGMTGLVHPSWRTYQPFGRHLGSCVLLTGGGPGDAGGYVHGEARVFFTNLCDGSTFGHRESAGLRPTVWRRAGG